MESELETMLPKKGPGGIKAALHGKTGRKSLALVLKADTAGTLEAVSSSLNSLRTNDVIIEVIHEGIGNVSKSDLLMAETGSRLVVGFNVDILPRVGEFAAERQIEIRIYDVIYTLTNDIREIEGTLSGNEAEEEKISGRANVIALFPGGRKGIIMGCEVLEGSLEQGKKFRIISDPGIVHVGMIDSLHIGKMRVKKATRGQQAGLKVFGFNRIKTGDLVECFEIIPARNRRWRPRGGAFDLRSTGG
jgi:translation initiation factor IF-2